MANKVVVVIDPTSFGRIIRNSERAEALCSVAAHEVVAAAKFVFISQNLLHNEGDLSQNTPPKYINSFAVHRKGFGRFGYSYRASNHDPAWNMVEWGSHAGGKTRVLRYMPLTRGLLIVGGTQ